VPDLLCRQPIPFRRRRLIEQPCEKAKSLQIRETLHEDLLEMNGRADASMVDQADG
jgi:hypothetical protein